MEGRLEMSQKSEYSGYIVNYYRYPKLTSSSQKCLTDAINAETTRKKTSYISFGKFDRMEIVPIRTFDEYYSPRQSKCDWLGKKLSVLLYTIGNELLSYDGETWYSLTGSKKKSLNRKFVILTLFSLSNQLHDTVNDFIKFFPKLKSEMVKAIKEIEHTIHVKKDSIDFDILGSFNTSEIAVVWLADQYTDTLKIVDYLKHLNFKGYPVKNSELYPAFFLSSSFISWNKKCPANECSNVSGIAYLQISVKDGKLSHQELTQELITRLGLENSAIKQTSKSPLDYSAGEYDIFLKLNSNQVISFFLKKEIEGRNAMPGQGSLRYSNEFYISHLLQTNVDLGYSDKLTSKDSNKDRDIKFLDLGGVLSDPSPIETESGFQEILNYNEKVKRDDLSCKFAQVKNAFSSNPAMSDLVDTCQLLLNDYYSNITSTYSSLWVQDFLCQFDGVFHAIYETILLFYGKNSKTNISPRQFIKRLREIINDLKQQIYHLSQSNRYTLDVPSSHLRYTGQQDFLLHSYYGVIKSLLKIVYTITSPSEQSEIIPLITVEGKQRDLLRARESKR